jgi:hypothetical protein
MIDRNNVEQVNPFGADDARVAARLGLTLPELWVTDRYDERLAIEGLSLQVNPDELIKGYDRLEIQLQRGGFGILFDSLRHDEGAETQRKYHIPKHFERDMSNVPFFTLLADPTPTTQEESAELADFGLLLGSRVMADLAEYKTAEEIEEERDKQAEHLKVGGLVAHVVTSAGNLGAMAAGIYQAVPYLGSGAGTVVVLGGVGARIVTAIKSRHIKEQELCEFDEDEVEGSVGAVAKTVKIVSFEPNLGGSSEVTRSKMKSIMAELDQIDRDAGL